MTNPLAFEKPLGMRDIIPESLVRQRQLENVLRDTIVRWGYDEILTPSLEYYDTVGAASPTLANRMFKLLDKQGHTLVLRPDMTTPIARVVSSLYQSVPFPIRLYYQTNVFRAQEREAGRNAEFFQTGVELIGDGSVDADAEAIALAVACLQAAQVPAFRIVIGHVDFVDGLLEETVEDRSVHTTLKQYLYERNFVGYRHLVESLECQEDERRRLLGVLRLRGGKGKISEAYELTINGKARKAVQRLASLWEALEAYDVTDQLLVDFNLIPDLTYYTGIVFEGYAADLGAALMGGGRYDHLLAQFGRKAPAIGFAIKIDRLMQVSEMEVSGQSPRLCILYSPNQRTYALKLAKRLREEGRQVTTHVIHDPAECKEWEKRTDVEIVALSEEET